jgi:hypothetical protein
MSQFPTAPPAVPPPTDRYSPAHRPTWLDFCCLLLGFALSLILAEWSGFTARETERTPAFVKDHLLRVMPSMLFLPVGLVVFWPLFFLTQQVRGRSEPMSSGEWLWGVGWLVVLPWIAWVLWTYLDTPPEMLVSVSFRRGVVLGYAVGALALGALAGLLTLIGLFARWRPPWTHSLCLVLLIWPALPLAACLAWGIALQ